MSKISNYLENEFVDHALGTGSLTMPASVHLALFTSDPTDAGSGTEVSGSGYARQEITMAKNGTRAAHNTSAESFTASGGSFGTVSHWGLFDASTSGNLLYHGAFNSAKAVADGETLDVAVNDLDITVASGGISNYLADKMLEHTLAIASWTAPASVHTALYTSNPADDNSGTEVSGAGYARQETAFDVAASGSADNSGTETFTASGGDFGTVSHAGVFDASTAGNLLFYGALNASADITDGDSLPFSAGAITVALD